LFIDEQLEIEYSIGYETFFILYFMQVLGGLSHPVVTLMWLLEQLSIHILGTTARASDMRIIVGFILNSAMIAIIYFVQQSSEKSKMGVAFLTVFLAFLSSHNLMYKLGIKLPFNRENQRLKD